MSSPPFPSNPLDGTLTPRAPPQFTPIRPDHSGTQEQLGTDGYDSNRSPTGSATMGDSGNAKRRKVNHGKLIEWFVYVG
jgi:hypothetical protein